MPIFSSKNSHMESIVNGAMKNGQCHNNSYATN